MINYTPSVIATGRRSWLTSRNRLGRPRRRVVSTINGDANVPFYKNSQPGIKATDIPVVAFSSAKKSSPASTPSVARPSRGLELLRVDQDAREREVHQAWQAYTKNPKRVTNDPMEAHVIGFDMWVKAVEKVKSTDPDKVIDALPGIEAKNLTGGTSKMLPNHHITKPVFIGEIKGNGQFDVVWKTRAWLPAMAWSKNLRAPRPDR